MRAGGKSNFVADGDEGLETEGFASGVGMPHLAPTGIRIGRRRSILHYSFYVT